MFLRSARRLKSCGTYLSNEIMCRYCVMLQERMLSTLDIDRATSVLIRFLCSNNALAVKTKIKDKELVVEVNESC